LSFNITMDLDDLLAYLEKTEKKTDELEERLFGYFQEAGYYAKELAQTFAPIGTVKNGPLDLPHGKLMVAAPVDGTGRHYAMAVEYGSNPWGGPTWVEGRPFLQPAVTMAMNYFLDKQAIPLIMETFGI
jgi:hypothetical protein